MTKREGGMEAPTRHPLDWQSDDFYDLQSLDTELARVFDICHGCRRCFNLCDSFPSLFDLIDQTPEEDVASLGRNDYTKVADSCTLCDMCYMTKCPYVPPHEFNLDFPHLMLRYKAVQARNDTKLLNIENEIAKTDRNAKVAGGIMAPLTNWVTSKKNIVARVVLEKTTGIDARASLPRFHRKTLVARSKTEDCIANEGAKAFGRKAIIYATCYLNYNDPNMGTLMRKVLAHNGVETKVLYDGCCGMPQLEKGQISDVATAATRIAELLVSYIEEGYAIVPLVPSCALMFKGEWPLILPDHGGVKRLAKATFDLSEYLMDIAEKEGLEDFKALSLNRREGESELESDKRRVIFHHACHARAQNMGAKGFDLLNRIPGLDVEIIERCSGHGGIWGTLKAYHDKALKVGKPVVQRVIQKNAHDVVSECPLAAQHIIDGLGAIGDNEKGKLRHPIELVAAAYGLMAID